MAKEIKRLADIEDKELRNKFSSIACQLSPENLYCDGEISHAQAQAKYRRLMAQWKELEKQNNIKLDPNWCY